MEKVYKSGIDIVKTLAVFFVVCVHFFLHSGFYYTAYEGTAMFLGGFLRNTFFICVPLFMITTGYLQRNKTFSKKFYKGIVNVLLSYGFIAVICILFKIFYLKEQGNILKWLRQITNFSADNYAWYVAMFTGLYLLIPFLNNAYRGCETKKQKLLLIAILFLISSVVCFNSYGVFNEYWYFLYPFLYYFIGAYISEYRIKINKLILVGIFVFTNLLVTAISFFKYHHGTFPLNMYGEYNSVFTVICAVTFFLIFYDMDIKNKKVKKILRSISSKTLEIYLFSYIFDTVIYTKALQHLNGYYSLVKFSAFIVLSVFLLSYLCAVFKDIIFKTAFKVINKHTEEKEIVSTNI